MKVPISVDIACPPEQVFRVLSDCRNETRWNTQVTKAELLSDEPVREGTRFHTINRGKLYEATVATFDRPSRVTFDVKGSIDMIATFDLRPTDGGTRLKGELDMSPNGMMKLLMPFIRSSISKDAAKQYANFGALCESIEG